MSSSSSQLLRVNAYQLEGDPYQLKQVSMAALAELARKKRVSAKEKKDSLTKEKPAAPVDPEVLRLRQEAEAMRLEAQKELVSAQERAAAMVLEAAQEIERKKSQAAEEGYADGLARGSEEGHERGKKMGEEEGLRQWAELVARWNAILEKTIEEKKNYLADREKIMVQLIAEVSSKILAHEVKIAPEAISYLVHQGIRKATERSKLVVHLNPQDLQRVQETQQGFEAEGVKQMEFLADPYVMAGGVIIETPNGVVDARLETQLAEVIKSFLEEAQHAQ